MFEHTFITIGLMALFLTVFSTLPSFDTVSKLIWSLMGMLFWVVWALQAESVQVMDGGTTVTESYQSLMVLGVIFAAVMLLSGVMRLFELYKE